MDKFPEAFRRFERVVNVDSFDSYRDMSYAFRHWAGKRWRNTYLQNRALAEEGWRLGFKDVKLPKWFGHTVEDEMRIKAVRARKEKWIVTYRKRVKKQIKVVAKKYKGVGKVRIKALSWYVSRGYSANKIQKRMKDRGLGIRRQTTLKIVREMRLKQKKAHAEKYIPKKYRKKKQKKRSKKR
jgi:hypothetical protein